MRGSDIVSAEKRGAADPGAPLLPTRGAPGSHQRSPSDAETRVSATHVQFIHPCRARTHVTARPDALGLPPATLMRTGMLLLSPVAYHAPGGGLWTSTESGGGACGEREQA